MMTHGHTHAAVKIPSLVALLLFTLACLLRAEKAEPDKPAPLSATEIVSQLDGLFDDDDENETVVTPERFAAILKKKMERFDRLAADFRKRFPEHPLRWRVQLFEALNLPVREQAGLPKPAGKSAGAMFDEILSAPDATADVKSDASVQRLMLTAEHVGEKKFKLDEWEKMLAKHWRDFPDAGDNASLEELHLGMVEEFAPARTGALIAELAKHKDSVIADMAKEKQAALKAMAELKSKPLDLKFKALDGAEVDFTKLRGKVVLVDFWATWCGPSMAELPKLTAAYAKFHARGFEIVGISLDEDEDVLKRVLKSKKIAWPQFFDGRGWESEIAHRFGVTALPTLWLVNKEGMLVEVNPEADLAEKIERLLK
jgi:thiol-disulfide isomerase/thioredoxin